MKVLKGEYASAYLITVVSKVPVTKFRAYENFAETKPFVQQVKEMTLLTLRCSKTCAAKSAAADGSHNAGLIRSRANSASRGIPIECEGGPAEPGSATAPPCLIKCTPSQGFGLIALSTDGP